MEGVLSEKVSVLVGVDDPGESSESTHALVFLHVTEESIDPLFRFSDDKLDYLIHELLIELPFFISVANEVLKESLAFFFVSELIIVFVFFIINFVFFKAIFIVISSVNISSCLCLLEEFSLHAFEFLMSFCVSLSIVVFPFLSIAVFARFTPFLNNFSFVFSSILMSIPASDLDLSLSLCELELSALLINDFSNFIEDFVAVVAELVVLELLILEVACDAN